MLHRFPVSIALLTALACYRFIFRIFDPYGLSGNTGGGFYNTLIYSPWRMYSFLIIGTIISVTATLLLEDLVGNIKRYVITAAAVLMWCLYCCWLPAAESVFEPAFLMSDGIGLFAIGVAAFLAMFFISFLKKDKDKSFWNFTSRTLFQLILAFCFGMILFLGLTFAFVAIDSLFQVDITDKIRPHVSTICNVLFAPLYFLANIPDKTAKHRDEILPNKTLKVLWLYILAPLAAAYVLILYAYMFKIIAVWELPRGMVSWLVSILSYCGLAAITFLYPYRLLGKNKIIEFFSRYFPLVIMPLLALMSIGIFRRIDDYGMTVLRGYLLSVNIWLYTIYIYVFITKGMRVKWIPISSAALLLLSSVGIQSVPNVTKHILIADIKKVLADDNDKIPLSDEGFFANMTNEDKTAMFDKIKYLQDMYGDESMKSLFTGSERTPAADISSLKQMLSIRQRVVDGQITLTSESYSSSGFSRYYGKNENKALPMPAFNAFVPLSYSQYMYLRRHKNEEYDIFSEIDYSFKQNLVTIKIIPEKRVFTIRLPEIDSPSKMDVRSKDNLFIEGDGYGVMVTRFSGMYFYDADTVAIDDFKGFLFYNR
ncbi:MAG: DUF4153 domain-containing protein [Chitinispirillia bacterium]|nr:DUF4153 domain-containing protein [Chitinispirillia bacterium]MCL2269011.1 DUF4153 domain-containing protein [Chitinispirillia bacterium]